MTHSAHLSVLLAIPAHPLLLSVAVPSLTLCAVLVFSSALVFAQIGADYKVPDYEEKLFLLQFSAIERKVHCLTH